MPTCLSFLSTTLHSFFHILIVSSSKLYLRICINHHVDVGCIYVNTGALSDYLILPDSSGLRLHIVVMPLASLRTPLQSSSTFIASLPVHYLLGAIPTYAIPMPRPTKRKVQSQSHVSCMIILKKCILSMFQYGGDGKLLNEELRLEESFPAKPATVPEPPCEPPSKKQKTWKVSTS